MVLITIVTGAYKLTYNWGGLTFYQPSQLNIGCFLVTVTLIVPRPEV